MILGKGGVSMKSIKQLFCKHDYVRVQTIHGDKIIYLGYVRSLWLCNKCDKEFWSKRLNSM